MDSATDQQVKDFDLNIQQWHLLHAIIDGTSLMIGATPIPDDATTEQFTEWCREHLAEMHGERDTIGRLHTRIHEIIESIEAGNKVIITVVPF